MGLFVPQDRTEEGMVRYIMFSGGTEVGRGELAGEEMEVEEMGSIWVEVADGQWLSFTVSEWGQIQRQEAVVNMDQDQVAEVVRARREEVSDALRKPA